MRTRDLEFARPATLKESDQRRERLLREMTDIQEQLGDRNRLNDGGKRMDFEEYSAWRRRAVHKMNEILAEIRFLKEAGRQFLREAVATLEKPEPRNR